MVYTLEFLRAPHADKEDPSAGFAYVIRLSGNFVLDVTEEFQLLFKTLLTGGMRKVALDLTELKYIDSTGIGAVIAAAKQTRTQGGDLVMVGLSGKIQEIVSLVKLGEFIPTFGDLRQVTKHFFPGA